MRSFLFAVILGLCLGLAPKGALAQSTIRDAEIEASLRNLLMPILEAAGLGQSIRVILLNDPRMNAFVRDARTIFVTSGLMMALDEPAELRAVLAHEAAHIANGHLARRPENADTMSGASRLGLVAGLLAAGVTGDAGAGAGVAAGMASSAQRVFFSHTRAEEASADAAALRYLERAGVDPTAMARVLDRFAGQELLSTDRQDPYVRTHPLTRDRLRLVANFDGGTAPPPDSEAQYWFDRSKGKLAAFLNPPSWTFAQVGSDPSEIATMRRAVAYHRNSEGDAALRELERLILNHPADPYYQELYAQVLFENRRYDAAIVAYERAIQMSPDAGLILAGYGRALLAPDSPARNAEALAALEAAFARERRNARLMRDLAMAYARDGQDGMAAWATAERAALEGDFETAALHARRATGLLPQGSSGWLRAQDVLRVAETKND